MDTNKDTKWNGHEKNEGFSGKNLSESYQPEASDQQKLKAENEKDVDGNPDTVKRARFSDGKQDSGSEGFADNSVIENRESLQNRDRNYDLDPNRYPAGHPENEENRGNVTGE